MSDVTGQQLTSPCLPSPLWDKAKLLVTTEMAVGCFQRHFFTTYIQEQRIDIGVFAAY
jgi:hypothetical protein